jgi:Rod binding domain-containing protein
MSSAISPVSSSVASHAPPDPNVEKLRRAATEFESLLVKQLLKAANMGGSSGSEKTSAYADMSVDALASAVERGGGLGLAKRIEEAIGHHVAPSTPMAHHGSGG